MKKKYCLGCGKVGYGPNGEWYDDEGYEVNFCSQKCAESNIEVEPEWSE